MRAVLFFLSLFIALYSHDRIDIAKVKNISLLEHCDVYISSNAKSIDDIKNINFKEHNKSKVRSVKSKNFVWIYFELFNSSNKEVEKVLVLNTPALEYAALYENGKKPPRVVGLMVKNQQDTTIYYYYKISLPPKGASSYYLKIYSNYKSLYLKVTIEDYDEFIQKEVYKQAPRLIMLGLLAGFMLYSFMIAYYSKDRSYFYYGMYLFFLLWHQISFLGLIKIYLPHWFVVFDLQFTIPKLGFILIFAILFAISFLKVPLNSWIMKGYLFFAILALLVIFVIKNLQIALIIGVAFVFYNLLAGIAAYKRGEKQARLFILGFGIVAIAYLIIVLDLFGVTSILSVLPNILMWATAFEVFVLTLAFADRYKIVEEEKRKLIKSREAKIKEEVDRKTRDLSKALREKELLLKEVHHRVKNNLQIILSIIRLQANKSSSAETKEMFKSLENRINAISKTYDMLVLNDLIEKVDMKKYISVLTNDLKNSLHGFINSDVKVNIKTNLSLPLRQAVYLGIIINELVTNSYKYAFDKEGEITIKLYEEGEDYVLIVEDNGKGFDIDKKSSSLGLKIIDILIKQQLEGSIEIQSKPSAKYIIKFSKNLVLR